ncbi:hypothetical protein HYC85_001257 [Camellia sinensis]|uniref:PPM-type phosphatase domain-containing protein n=1 Tax=Camellia sinensis TaxID=4442 RepID=A0A7J7I7D2_CAMSI|nr:hypothetical protein HYC85_001257 [Camellia sinensis]
MRRLRIQRFVMARLAKARKGRTSHLSRPNANAFTHLFDGHNGPAAAIYSKENLLNNVLACIPSNLHRDEWIAALPRALVVGILYFHVLLFATALNCRKK